MSCIMHSGCSCGSLFALTRLEAKPSDNPLVLAWCLITRHYSSSSRKQTEEPSANWCWFSTLVSVCSQKGWDSSSPDTYSCGSDWLCEQLLLSVKYPPEVTCNQPSKLFYFIFLKTSCIKKSDVFCGIKPIFFLV